ncbi:MAG: LPS assembly lipoprotein LptE [Pseudohongiellaceae bacterium]|nr:LPS assembly lipoprotein LptE [Pseudohongiellaceae bacterium]
MSTTIRLFFLSLLAVSLSGCGFSLRGSTSAMDETVSVYLNAQNPSDATAVSIRQALENSGVSVVQSDSADYTLALSAEQFSARPTTVNGRARAAQYELVLAIEFSLQQADTLLIPEETLAANRSYFEDLANISGSNEEQILLRTEMRTELVDKVIRRVATAAENASP